MFQGIRNYSKNRNNILRFVPMQFRYFITSEKCKKGLMRHTLGVGISEKHILIENVLIQSK